MCKRRQISAQLTVKYWLRAAEEFEEVREKFPSRRSTWTERIEVPFHVKRYLVMMTMMIMKMIAMMVMKIIDIKEYNDEDNDDIFLWFHLWRTSSTWPRVQCSCTGSSPGGSSHSWPVQRCPRCSNPTQTFVASQIVPPHDPNLLQDSPDPLPPPDPKSHLLLSGNILVPLWRSNSLLSCSHSNGCYEFRPKNMSLWILH